MSATTKLKTRTKVMVSLLASALALGALAPVVQSTPAEAACKPVARTTNKVIVGNLYTYMNLNACAAKKLYTSAGNQSAKLILPSLAAGWIPGTAGKLIGSYLGSQAGVLWLTQKKLTTCTKNFTVSAQIVFSRGVPTACSVLTRAHRDGGGYF
ncbi:hypothetical protein [Microbacterium stercoris]|uniref:Uncharacterized protein n=1 Tax=Microbacterium stercoris TaxID=2820289 RepID=A0A939QLL8_9MICO|nr:hypothetical protein [Microbacterium stercoris]MBO3663957.1 hypothetical protein [Microbacterium stercoris]